LHVNIHQCIKIMKKFIILLIIPLIGLLQANAQTQPATPATTVTPAKTAVNPNAPVAKWDKMVIDMGEIPQNIPKSADFTLTNDGKEPLIISSAKASCGCTTPKYSTEPILPGKSSVLTATYNALTPGVFNKAVTVITNADTNPVILTIKGTVK
jgi:hypothetical protein